MWTDPINLNPASPHPPTLPPTLRALCSARQWLPNFAFRQGATKFSIPSWNSPFFYRQLLNLLFSVFWLASCLLSFPQGEEVIGLQLMLPGLLHGPRQQGGGKQPSKSILRPGSGEPSILDDVLGAAQPWPAGPALLTPAARALLPQNAWERSFKLDFQDHIMKAETWGIDHGPLKAW